MSVHCANCGCTRDGFHHHVRGELGEYCGATNGATHWKPNEAEITAGTGEEGNVSLFEGLLGGGIANIAAQTAQAQVELQQQAHSAIQWGDTSAALATDARAVRETRIRNANMQRRAKVLSVFDWSRHCDLSYLDSFFREWGWEPLEVPQEVL